MIGYLPFWLLIIIIYFIYLFTKWILFASAAGVYASSVSDSIFRFNNISWSSRWGIAIRSNGGGAMSYRNYIGWNRIDYTGTKTMDFGGISLIGEGYTGNIDIYTIKLCARIVLMHIL